MDQPGCSEEEKKMAPFFPSPAAISREPRFRSSVVVRKQMRHSRVDKEAAVHYRLTQVRMSGLRNE